MGEERLRSEVVGKEGEEGGRPRNTGMRVNDKNARLLLSWSRYDIPD